MTLETLARDYVRLVLEIDAHESGDVDADSGPDDWREDARRNPRERPALKREADRIKAALPAFVAAGGEQGQRARVLLADVSSARFRLDMIDGKRVPFADEAERLSALRPVLKPLATFDEALARIDGLIPGSRAPVRARRKFSHALFHSRRACAACDGCGLSPSAANALAAYIPLPPGESFSMELVKGQSWARTIIISAAIRASSRSTPTCRSRSAMR